MHCLGPLLGSSTGRMESSDSVGIGTVNDRLIIVKAGSTFPDALALYGDFDVWIAEALGIASDQVSVIDLELGDDPPPLHICRGVVLAGSHLMVTDNHPWMGKVSDWISQLVAESIPLFGICFGHQLLAQAMGGEVGYHPLGKEIGTVDIDLLPWCRDDQLLGLLPPRFPAHVTHSQSVVRLPRGAVRLARSSFEENHAFRLGPCAWGVQFHPEFDTRIMECYLSHQPSEGEQGRLDLSAIWSGIRKTPQAKGILLGFAKLTLGSSVQG